MKNKAGNTKLPLTGKNKEDEKELPGDYPPSEDIYTKFNIIDLKEGTRVVVISFHKRNKPIDYLFR